jgi:cation-transporting P-type ATPase 13A2
VLFVAELLQVFAGPMSESIPTSITGFAHRRGRSDSITSFTYFQEDNEVPEWPEEEEAVADYSDEENIFDTIEDRDLEAGSISSRQRQTSSRSRYSADEPLLKRSDSTKSDTRAHDEGGNFSQKLYIITEDLTIVIAGFKTSMFGYAAYTTTCICTIGLAYLLFRWMPRWRIKLVGSPAPLKACSWVVIEVSSWHGRPKSHTWAKTGQNQWGEFTVHNVSTEEYGHPLSTVFGFPPKEGINGYNDDDDPILKALRILDYRYMRLLFHPVEDKFILNNNWADPQWTDVKALREGLDSDERDIRDQVFGKNVLEIQQKSVLQLLMDEVSHQLWILDWLIDLGISSFLRISNCQFNSLVAGRILLLRHCDIHNFRFQYHHHHRRD